MQQCIKGSETLTNTSYDVLYPYEINIDQKLYIYYLTREIIFIIFHRQSQSKIYF